MVENWARQNMVENWAPLGPKKGPPYTLEFQKLIGFALQCFEGGDTVPTSPLSQGPCEGSNLIMAIEES